MNNSKKIVQLLLHLIPWLVLLLGPFSSLMFNQNINDGIRLRSITIFFILLGSFYINYFLLIPKLLFQRKFIIYGISLLGLIVMIAIFSSATHHYLMSEGFLPLPPKGGNPPPMPTIFPQQFAPIVASMLFAIGIAARMTSRWFEQDKQHKAIKQEQLKTELAFLKNQVSPHFFFNTLNNIYALTESDPKQAREVTHQLSKLMRYLLYESEKNTLVTLGREIAFLKTYVELMKVRLPETVTLNFDHGSETDNTELPALLFITFVENAFKHGISLQENCSIKISLHRVNNEIQFSIINTIPSMKERINSSGGVGLTNIKRRLELLFGKGNYNLKITEIDNVYDIQLNLPIND
jgi:LytS/YehU family sensor histidine kinase